MRTSNHWPTGHFASAMLSLLGCRYSSEAAQEAASSVTPACADWPFGPLHPRSRLVGGGRVGVPRRPFLLADVSASPGRGVHC